MASVFKHFYYQKKIQIYVSTLVMLSKESTFLEAHFYYSLSTLVRESLKGSDLVYVLVNIQILLPITKRKAV